jgi:hypothetical protein
MEAHLAAEPSQSPVMPLASATPPEAQEVTAMPATNAHNRDSGDRMLLPSAELLHGERPPPQGALRLHPGRLNFR